MRLSLPLGLLALLSIAVLIIIYIIRPSYQSKTLPSTYIWRESLKLKRRERSGSILRDLLSLICQILALVLCAVIIATPLLVVHAAGDFDMSILIIDASADMQAASGGTTRFERAVERAERLAGEAIEDGRSVSVILAGDEAEYLLADENDEEEVGRVLSSAECGYGSADVEGALSLAEKLMDGGIYADVTLFTATKYSQSEGVSVVDVSVDGEWNAAALDLAAEYEENYYNFYASVASYERDCYLVVTLTVEGVNNEGTTIKEQKRVYCAEGMVVEVSFSDLGIYSYSSAQVAVAADDGISDGFAADDSFTLFGGEKESISVQYASTLPNNFLSGALLVLQSQYQDRWNIAVDQPTKSSDFATSGYDLYIYEHTLPSVLPTDGVVLLIDPDSSPLGGDFTLSAAKTGEFTMTAGQTSAITNYVDVSSITATKYRAITASEEYVPLMYCEGDAVFVAKNTENSKVAVLGLDLNRSNLAVLMEFPVLIDNLFNYYFPQTIQKSVYDVGEDIAVNARGYGVRLEGDNVSDQLTVPASVSVAKPGQYAITQTLLSGKTSSTRFFVKVPSVQSDITRAEDVLPGAALIEEERDVEYDIYLWLAIALAVVLAAERALYAFKGI